MASHTARILLECNFRCPFCFAAWHEEEEGAPIPLQDKESASMDRWQGYLDAMQAKGHKRLTISGGEPTMHPNIVPLIRRARRMGYEAVDLQTNGSLLTRKNAERLAKAGLTDALVSLHSHLPATFDRITVTDGLFDTVVAGIKHFLDLGIQVDVSHVILSWNVEDMTEYVQFIAAELPGLRDVHLLSMHPEARARRNMHLWPKLGLVREHLPRAYAEAERLGVSLRMDSLEGFPMCFVNGHEDQVDLADVTRPAEVFGEEDHHVGVIQKKKVKVPQCEGCFFQSSCYGFWESYFVIHGTDGIVPVERSERLERLFPSLGAAPPKLRQVRDPSKREIIDEETVAEIPDDWRSRRKAAQEV